MNVIDVKLLQFEKALLPIVFTLDGIDIDVNFLHPLKLLLLIEVIPEDILTVVKLVHPLKILSQMYSTLAGTVADFKQQKLFKDF